ncbi:hypothetical protein AB0G03_06550 [Micromonospora aurantiaca]|uniref:hypothetical protein n=1 Tax=Micromonospora aurantiaca (nom. illeg.) TaxID=47850 RepID=UPI0033E84AAF
MERDWFDWASLIFNTLATSAGLVGLFIAIRAYKVAKNQQLTTYDLEQLRRLHDIANSYRFRRAFKAAAGKDVHAANMGELFERFGVEQLLSNLLTGRQAGEHRLGSWYYLSYDPYGPSRTHPKVKAWGKALEGCSVDEVHNVLVIEVRIAIQNRLLPRGARLPQD